MSHKLDFLGYFQPRFSHRTASERTNIVACTSSVPNERVTEGDDETFRKNTVDLVVTGNSTIYNVTRLHPNALKQISCFEVETRIRWYIDSRHFLLTPTN